MTAPAAILGIAGDADGITITVRTEGEGAALAARARVLGDQ